MKKAMLILIALMVSLILGLPAFADGSDTGTTTVKETVKDETNITNDVSIEVNQNANLEHAAEASIMGAAGNTGNVVSEDRMVMSEASIDSDSFSGVIGIISVNQAPGTMNNQGNSVSVPLVKDAAGTLLHSVSAINQSSSLNEVNANGSFRSNIITDNAFNSASGIIGVNQAAGNLNNQNNIVSVSIGGTPTVSLSAADLRAVSGNNKTFETRVIKKDLITGSAFTGVSGIISINQSSGNMNNQVNVVTISVHTFPLK